MKRFKSILENISMWTWEILQTVIGLFVVMIYGAKLYKKVGQRFVFISSKFPGGISLGAIIVAGDYAKNSDLTVFHEWGHTRQSLYLGPLYLFVIGIPSILNAAFDFTKYYYDFYTEKWADHCAGIIRKGAHGRYVSEKSYILTGTPVPKGLI